MSAERLDIARKALEEISDWKFGWDGDCGVTKRADDALAAIDVIAPPVAVGSVDSPAFRNMLATWSGHNEDWRIRHASETMDGIVAHINAWGAQIVADAVQGAQQSIEFLEERAEKAEADLKARDLFVDVLNCQVRKAEARVKELEAALAKAHPNAINPGDTPC